MALERGIVDETARYPDAEAVLKKTAAFVKGFFEKVQFAKEIVETSDFMLRAYGAATLITQGVQPVAGLLSDLTGR